MIIEIFPHANYFVENFHSSMSCEQQTRTHCSEIYGLCTPGHGAECRILCHSHAFIWAMRKFKLNSLKMKIEIYSKVLLAYAHII